MCGTTPARAQMIMGITTNSFIAGSSSNSLDVTLTNTGGSAVTIGGFSFEITAASSNVNFEDVTDQHRERRVHLRGELALRPGHLAKWDARQLRPDDQRRG